MPSYRITKRLDESSIDATDIAYSSEHGAVLQFLGVIRESEEGRPLIGIRYSCYDEMARQLLDQTITAAQSEFGEHGLDFHHRLGFVSVAEPSVLVRVSSPHSESAYLLCQHYLRAVKTTLPIWKEPIFAS
ncbi:MAG: hypothetical protein GWQ05_03850 [Verrucomicrobiaceae bacterium]|nr:hypothetical protein [Verrucomicrobiaceae bacterium]